MTNTLDTVYTEDMKDVTVSTSDFRTIRQCDMVYVDKTEYIHRLVSSPEGSFFFLSRPRRFGKSLFCSTLHELFEGNRELFEGLYITEKTDYGFGKYPVIHFSFSRLTMLREFFLSDLQETIELEGERHGIELRCSSPSKMLELLIMKLVQKTEKKVVIIIDEYDSPFTSLLESDDRAFIGEVRAVFNSLYKTIKDMTGSIRMLFITGIVKLANLSIFSAMNNLNDISMDPVFATALGYTEKELSDYFGEGMDEYLEEHPGEYESREDFQRKIREYYDGYRFSYMSDESVYNPVSIGFFFTKYHEFRAWWIETGASTMAVEIARNNSLTELLDDERLLVSPEAFSIFDIEDIAKGKLSIEGACTFLYYAGYLSICAYDDNAIGMGFPNNEVRRSFVRDLVRKYRGNTDLNDALWMMSFTRACREGNAGEVMGRLDEYFSAFSYELAGNMGERFYHAIFHAVFIMAGMLSYSEDRGYRGRADEAIVTDRYIWIFELKVDRSAEDALQQIEERGYARKYSYLMKPEMKVHKVGISFSSSEKRITEWKCI